MGAADGADPGLRKAEMLDLALGDQFLHRTGDILDRDVRIDAVLIKEIDPVGLEALERRIRHRPDAFGAAVGAAGAGAGAVRSGGPTLWPLGGGVGEVDHGHTIAMGRTLDQRKKAAGRRGAAAVRSGLRTGRYSRVSWR